LNHCHARRVLRLRIGPQLEYRAVVENMSTCPACRTQGIAVVHLRRISDPGMVELSRGNARPAPSGPFSTSEFDTGAAQQLPPAGGTADGHHRPPGFDDCLICGMVFSSVILPIEPGTLQEPLRIHGHGAPASTAPARARRIAPSVKIRTSNCS